MKGLAEAGKFAAVLLAAGSSSRLGLPKQSVMLDGVSLVRRAALELLKLDPISVTVVTGSGGDAVKKDLSGLRTLIAHNEDWAQGIGSSIACGARHVDEDTDGILISLCDQWKVDARDLGAIVSAWQSDISRIVSASWFDDEAFIYGAPTLFPRKYIRELQKLTDDRGAKSLIGRNREKVNFVTVENAAFDLDRPADLEQLFIQAGRNPSS